MTSTTHPAHGHLLLRRRRRRTVVIAATLVFLSLLGWLAKIAYDAIVGKPPITDSCQVVGLSTRTVYAMTPEQLLNASIIADVAMRRNLPQRAVTVALATAQQESHLRNLDYGDADSIGLFQQRPSQGWGSPAQIMTPTYAAGKFYDALVKVPNWQTIPVAQAADAVQRSAFPEAVAEWEPRATALSAALTGDTLGQLSCRLRHPGIEKAPADTAPASLDVAATSVTAGLRDDLQINFPAIAPVDSTTRTITVSGLVDTSSGGDNAAKHRTATVAAWGIAHAKSHGITRIVIGDREWRAADADGWRSAASPAADGAVVLTIAARGGSD